MIDRNTIKWINSSINDYFMSNRGSYPLYIEGQNYDPIANGGNAWCELHISVGPNIEEVSNDEYIAEVIVTLICSALPTDDAYLIHKIAGYFANLASQAFQVKKFGDGNSVIGCIQPVKDVRVQQWGYVQLSSSVTPVQVNQTHVESSYMLTL